jgi:protein-tyrosine phosphatase
MASRAHAFYLRATDGPAPLRARYGSARGLARLWLARLRPMGRFAEIDWDMVERLVFVCTGNVCRSPYAEARARESGLAAVSAALRGAPGALADAQAAAAARAVGIDLAAHRAQTVDQVEVDRGDLLVAMEPWQADALASRFAGRPGVQVTLLGLWSTPRRPHLHDPHRLCDDYFRTCFAVIDSAVAAMRRNLGR